MRYDRSICWLRRDLRLKDNLALGAAARYAKFVIPVFVFDNNILNKNKNKNDRRIGFIHQSLVELDQMLQQKESYMRAMALEYETNQGDYSFFGQPDGAHPYVGYQPYHALKR